MINTPVLLIIFNRPETTDQVFQAIRNVKPKKLFVAADGPRDGKSEDVEKCKQTREVVKKIDWDCELKTLFREKNLGCKYGPSTAIDWFFQHVEYGIILEDDCVPASSFFKFCEDMLLRYSTDNEIMMISGSNFLFGKKNSTYSYFFTKIHFIWGWATWKRAWDKLDLEMGSWPHVNKKKFWPREFSRFVKTYWELLFTYSFKNEIGFNAIWDFQWYYSILKCNGLVICPALNLVKNIGNNGVHINSDLPTLNIQTDDLKFPLVHPDKKVVDNVTEKILFKNFHSACAPKRFKLKCFILSLFRL